jgi:hypothetical protein
MLAALLRADVRAAGGGASWAVGGALRLGERVEVTLAAELGVEMGMYAGASFALLRGRLRPLLVVGVPVFFADSTLIGARAAAGLHYDLSRRIGVYLEVGGDYLFNAGHYEAFTFLPSLGLEVGL